MYAVKIKGSMFNTNVKFPTPSHARVEVHK